MRIAALHKTSLIDFPGLVSALVFTPGCNFHCPYCHNPQVLLASAPELAETEVLAFLHRRKAVLQGLVISGGEPTLHPGLEHFCSTLKSMGYAVKLDTNGSRPDVLDRLLRAGCLDYVAMDIKTDPTAYPADISETPQGDSIIRSITMLQKSAVAHEFRIPAAAPFITEKKFTAVLDALRDPAHIFLQKIILGPVLNQEYFSCNGRVLEENELEPLRHAARQRGHHCQIR